MNKSQETKELGKTREKAKSWEIIAPNHIQQQKNPL